MKDETKQSKRLTAEAVHAITNTLSDFGYKNLTDGRVRELSDGLLDGSISYPYRTGESPKGGTITRFIAGQLSDAGCPRMKGTLEVRATGEQIIPRSEREVFEQLGVSYRETAEL